MSKWLAVLAATNAGRLIGGVSEDVRCARYAR
jgi:hypothetical protein